MNRKMKDKKNGSGVAIPMNKQRRRTCPSNITTLSLNTQTAMDIGTKSDNNIESKKKSITEPHINGFRGTTNEEKSPKRRKLILHFDNRNTLQVANSVSATTIEQGVNNFLTGVLWGYELNNEWIWVSTSPSLEKPSNCPKCTTYFKYLEGQIVKETIDRKILREKTGNFVHNEGARFRAFYDELVEFLRYNKSGSDERQREDQILLAEKNEQVVNTKETPTDERRRSHSCLHKKELPVNGFRSDDGTLYHYIFPSFFRLLQYLQETKREFVIYLRTMGDDSVHFLANTKRVVSNEHPAFHFDKKIDVNLQPGHLARQEDKPMQLTVPIDGKEESFDDEFSIHKILERQLGIHGIKDDFDAWRRTNYHYTTSKPVWFDPDDPKPSSHHILFDDNFRVIDPHDSIVDIRLMNRQTKQCCSCSFEHYPELDNIFAVQADLYQILTNENYYIDKVKECEDNLDRLLNNVELCQKLKQQTVMNEHA